MPKALVIDACALINLAATGRDEEIVGALGATLITSTHARSEVRYRYGPLDEEGNKTRIAIDLNPLVVKRLLDIRTIEGALVDGFVKAVGTGLRDADASVVALAEHLEIPLVTDDNRMRKIALREFPSIPVQSTLGLLRSAVKRLQWRDGEIRALLETMSYSGNFIPPKTDPERKWFERILRAT